MTPVMASLAELIRSTPEYKDNYEWFVELAKNFHWIQSKMVESVDKVRLEIHLRLKIDFENIQRKLKLNGKVSINIKVGDECRQNF